MRLSSKPVAIVSALALLALIAAAFFMTGSPAAETCFDRLGGEGPNSNTPRLDTLLDIPDDQWPAVARVLRQFAADHRWSVQEARGTDDSAISTLDMCDQAVTIVRASSQYGGGASRIGFGIIHMNYQGPGNDGWRPVYRELHRRLEARWRGRMRYIDGEFGQPIARPTWLGRPEQAAHE